MYPDNREDHVGRIMQEMQNRDTGRYPTEKEARCILRQAEIYWQSPYAAPEQRVWALKVCPELLDTLADDGTRTA